MSGPSIAETLGDLCDAFYSEIPPERTLALYVRELSDVPPWLLSRTVEVMIRERERFPKIAQIRRAAAEELLALPSEAEALMQIEQRTAWARLGASDGAVGPPHVHPLVRLCLERVGGYHAFRAADDASVVLGQFGRLYRDERARAVREVQVGGFTAENLPLAAASSGALGYPVT